MKQLSWLYAKLNLAVALVIHLFYKRWFQKRGLKHFLEDYAGDHLFPLSKSERDRDSRYGNCIQCGICVTECAVTAPAFYQKFITPAQIAFSYTRSLPEIVFAGDFVSYCGECRACEQICPTGVPLNDIIAFVKKHGH